MINVIEVIFRRNWSKINFPRACENTMTYQFLNQRCTSHKDINNVCFYNIIPGHFSLQKETLCPQRSLSIRPSSQFLANTQSTFLKRFLSVCNSCMGFHRDISIYATVNPGLVHPVILPVPSCPPKRTNRAHFHIHT